MKVGITQSVEDLNRTKGSGKENLLSLLELGHLSSPALSHQHSWFSSLQTWTGTYIIGPLDPLRLNYIAGFLGSPSLYFFIVVKCMQY